MSVFDMAIKAELDLLTDLANKALCLWDLPPATSAKLINVAENTTFLVETPDKERSVLRIHRENYHSKRAIQCELEWTAALKGRGAAWSKRPAIIWAKTAMPSSKDQSKA